MSRLNRIEKFFVYMLILWTVLNIVLWVTAKESLYVQKEQFWPFLHGSHNGVAYTYDFREFIIYTFVPWTLFFMIDSLARTYHSKTHQS
jgi:predicted secreted protein